ncbi:hypothetical protein VMCG_08414 [Cytospora schulzeri]|uniref:Uncharacterized protein n=1 Tax=Cytospora schulzeri TaxID=448051 RepID=A0A423VQX2_9PEZI|nr:hypothetical protein VMCG_08414 [Valsa malicola]
MATLTGVPIFHRPSKKITKPRAKIVTPILKKVIPQSPKNSLDLDRGWDDQTADFGCGGIYESERPSMSPSARDVTFPVTPWEPSGYSSGVVGGGGSGRVTPVGGIESTTAATATVAPRSSINLHRGRFQHARSSSGHSHASITTTSGSCHRHGGSFVHPFQQMPRTNTPPVTYANSFTSFERENIPRDYSPTVITENEDDEHLDLHSSTSLTHQPPSAHLHRVQPSNSHSTVSLRRPSFASQRTSSLTDLNNNVNVVSAPLRVNTAPICRSHPAPPPTSTPRATTHGSLNTSFSQSDLQLDSSNPADSPRPSLTLASPSTSVAAAPMSPIRNSLEGAFRLRSRSEIDTGARREDIREARRKFEEKERMKQEKYESDQRKKMERKDSKLEKTNSIIGRPSFSRKRTPPRTASRQAAKSVEILRPDTIDEKVHHQRPGSAFMSSNYESTEGGEVPSFGPDVTDVRFETPKRANGAKRKTQSYWTSFMLWLRTRLLKMGRR